MIYVTYIASNAQTQPWTAEFKTHQCQSSVPIAQAQALRSYLSRAHAVRAVNMTITSGGTLILCGCRNSIQQDLQIRIARAR